MIKFLKKELIEEKEEIVLTKEYKDNFSTCDINESPIKEFIYQENYFVFSFTLNDSEEEISLKDAFTLKVNIKGNGSVIISLPLKDSPKGEILSQIMDLKKMEINDLSSSKEKMKTLLTLIKEYHPYFVIYEPKDEYHLSLDEIREIYPLGETPLLYVPYVEQKEVVKEEAPKEVTQKKDEKEIDVSKLSGFDKFKAQAKLDIKNIIKNKYHFIFLTISTFLFGFASSVGLCNAIIGKTISILFFVCAGVGLFLGTYIYIDYFKERKIKDRLFIYSVLYNLLGYLISLLASYLFYNFDKGEIKSHISSKLLVGSSLGMGIAMIIISIALGFIINYFKPKKENSKESK